MQIAHNQRLMGMVKLDESSLMMANLSLLCVAGAPFGVMYCKWHNLDCCFMFHKYIFATLATICRL